LVFLNLPKDVIKIDGGMPTTDFAAIGREASRRKRLVGIGTVLAATGAVIQFVASLRVCDRPSAFLVRLFAKARERSERPGHARCLGIGPGIETREKTIARERTTVLRC